MDFTIGTLEQKSTSGEGDKYTKFIFCIFKNKGFYPSELS